MRLATRMWLLGALLPSLGTVGVAVAAGSLLRARLEAALDQALLAQAAVETVSLFDGAGELFDGPQGAVHLHLASSPLLDEVRPFAPSGELFGPDGTRLLWYPMDGAFAPAPPGEVDLRPALATGADAEGDPLRLLTVGVRSPSQHPYTLRLSASLAHVDATMRTYWRSSLLASLLFGLLWLAVQTWQAQRLSRRLARLTRHSARLREGRLDESLPPDTAHDEVRDLHDVLAEATLHLREARAAQERLVADAAHELRTPLTLMRTSIDLALRRNRTAEELREALADARSEVDRLAALATQLLDLAAHGRGLARTPGDLRAVVEEALEAARAEAERRQVVLRLDAPAEAEAAFDAGAIRQAVDNMLSNALKYSPPGGTLSVRLARGGAGWALSVSDQGPGIAADQREAVFAPFHRVPGSREGTGLGLAIVREVAKGHGGRAYVAERSETGTELVLEIAA